MCSVWFVTVMACSMSMEVVSVALVVYQTTVLFGISCGAYGYVFSPTVLFRIWVFACACIACLCRYCSLDA